MSEKKNELDELLVLCNFPKPLSGPKRIAWNFLFNPNPTEEEAKEFPQLLKKENEYFLRLLFEIIVVPKEEVGPEDYESYRKFLLKNPKIAKELRESKMKTNKLKKNITTNCCKPVN